MQSYELSKDAEQDLREVARYTLNRWGKEILQQYRNGLKDTFGAIAANDVPKQAFSKAFPGLMVTKHRHHFIFYLINRPHKPIIIGVIHESRDIVSRLGGRLG